MLQKTYPRSYLHVIFISSAYFENLHHGVYLIKTLLFLNFPNWEPVLKFEINQNTSVYIILLSPDSSQRSSMEW